LDIEAEAQHGIDRSERNDWFPSNTEEDDEDDYFNLKPQNSQRSMREEITSTTTLKAQEAHHINTDEEGLLIFRD